MTVEVHEVEKMGTFSFGRCEFWFWFYELFFESFAEWRYWASYRCFRVQDWAQCLKYSGQSVNELFPHPWDRSRRDMKMMQP